MLRSLGVEGLHSDVPLVHSPNRRQRGIPRPRQLRSNRPALDSPFRSGRRTRRWRHLGRTGPNGIHRMVRRLSPELKRQQRCVPVTLGEHRQDKSPARSRIDHEMAVTTSEPACRRDSVHRAVAGAGWVVIHLSGLPGDIGRASRPTFDLAPGGVYRAAQVALGAGALLPHRFTLTSATTFRTMPSAVCFLWHFPAGHPDWPLASTQPFGVPTFLDQVAGPNYRDHA